MSTTCLGNRAGLPFHKEYLEDLGVPLEKCRVYWVGKPGIDEYEDDLVWQLDGYTVVDGQFAVTQTCWNVGTFEEAFAHLEEFWRTVKEITS